MLLVKLLFGSHLYGTNTENSDKDYKGVYLPSLEDCIFNKVSKSFSENSRSHKQSGEKNTKDDIDYEIYSLQYFIMNMGISGDTSFLDMIHAPDYCIIETSEIWENIRRNRSKFYTKNLKSYLGYCRSQAAKYGIKGSRLAEAENVLNCLNKAYSSNLPHLKLKDIWDYLPDGEHIKRYNIFSARNSGDTRCYDVCGKKLMYNTPMNEAINIIKLFIDNYGARAKLARDNCGIDWKALSHAFRVGFQMKQLYTSNDIVFPLEEKDFLIKLKKGEFHYSNDGIGESLEELIDQVEDLSLKSNLPDKVDYNFCEKIILDSYKIN